MTDDDEEMIYGAQYLVPEEYGGGVITLPPLMRFVTLREFAEECGQTEAETEAHLANLALHKIITWAPMGRGGGLLGLPLAGKDGDLILPPPYEDGGPSMSEEELTEVWGAEAVAHSKRFRKVSTRYPYIVAMAYEHDIARAAAASDEEVAERVAAYEEAYGWGPRDWVAIGREERADDE
jgi:hypothetical protein